MSENLSENLITVDFDCEKKHFTISYNGKICTVKSIVLHEKAYKFFSEFCNFFQSLMHADENSSILFTNAANNSLNIIQEFNRISW